MVQKSKSNIYSKHLNIPTKQFNIYLKKTSSKEKKLCTFILRKSGRVLISGSRQTASFKLDGPTAETMTKNFKLNDRGEAFFQSSDKVFRIFKNVRFLLF